jgi:hypothetical protein
MFYRVGLDLNSYFDFAVFAPAKKPWRTGGTLSRKDKKF